jgi:lysyl-tRNA synthetase class 2
MNARQVLELRDRVRRQVRGLFDGLGFLEVDTPVLAREVLPEAHIDPVTVLLEGDSGGERYLQASPEALMKRLLAAGSGPIYQLARSFRAGERGRQHDLEFVLLEWYAPGTGLDDAAVVLERLCATVLGTRGIDRVSCSDAFGAHAGVDPLEAGAAELEDAVRRAGLELPESAARLPEAERRDRAFEMLLAEAVQPHLGHGRPVMLERWPASQAALARIAAAEPPAALRFELFCRGVELANGWEEETRRGPLETRIEAANSARVADGRAPLPVPGSLLDCHGAAMPEGVGAALGFDRLVMLAAGADSIDAVRCFTSES